MVVAPFASVEDGIAASRGILGLSWFDEKRCKKGLGRLRGYRKNAQGREVHDDASHGAAAFRYGCMGFHLVGGFNAQTVFGGRLRRRLRGLI